MQKSKPTILIVDDETFNLDIMEEYLEDENYDILKSSDGGEAWHILQQDPEVFDVVLLDRMMPGLDGIEVLERMKAHAVLRNVQVVLQTARAANQDIVDGLNAGAFYYLTKPFEEDMLRSVVQTALGDRTRYQLVQNEVKKHAGTFGLMQSGRFLFRTLEQGQDLASVLANACPEPTSIVTGLLELMINAVEHGNLGICYQEKSKLNKTGNWAAEVQRRLALPENAHKEVEVKYLRCNGEIRIAVTDQGGGFDWRPFVDMTPERVFDSHGRGIAMARMLSFDHLEFNKKGNEVVAVIDLNS
ncbi:MAG: response regulator [Gammaproteobacteria bacterium]|nr:response regulator [Gammaproteobacteria bacterium]